MLGVFEVSKGQMTTYAEELETAIRASITEGDIEVAMIMRGVHKGEILVLGIWREGDLCGFAFTKPDLQINVAGHNDDGKPICNVTRCLLLYGLWSGGHMSEDEWIEACGHLEKIAVVAGRERIIAVTENEHVENIAKACGWHMKTTLWKDLNVEGK